MHIFVNVSWGKKYYWLSKLLSVALAAFDGKRPLDRKLTFSCWPCIVGIYEGRSVLPHKIYCYYWLIELLRHSDRRSWDCYAARCFHSWIHPVCHHLVIFLKTSSILFYLYPPINRRDHSTRLRLGLWLKNDGFSNTTFFIVRPASTTPSILNWNPHFRFVFCI